MDITSTEKIVHMADAMATHLQKGGENNYYVFYDQSFPSEALTYWNNVCPHCQSWTNGNLQCGMFVSAAYGLAGVNLSMVNTVIEWWPYYAHKAGWTEIADGTETPQPGDIVILASPYFGGEGHAGIVTNVDPPLDTIDGSITFANANGPNALETQVLARGNILHTWKGYTVKGYIRYTPTK